jgi:hypothetical protein
MATDDAATDAATVRRLLAAMGIAPPSDEVDEMIKSYSGLRASADALYTPEASRFVPVFSITDTERSSTNREAK